MMVTPSENRVGNFEAPPRKSASGDFFQNPNRTTYQLSPEALKLCGLQPVTATKTVSGVSVYGFRYYDAENGGWASRDPIEERGGVNLYGFVGNDGIGQFDMHGLSWRTGLSSNQGAPACASKRTEPIHVEYRQSGAHRSGKKIDWPGKEMGSNASQFTQKLMNDIETTEGETDCDKCIGDLSILAHGSPEAFNIEYVKGKTPKYRNSTKLGEASRISTDNAGEIFTKIAKLVCFCDPCRILIRSCNTGLNEGGWLNEIANATGCQVLSPKAYYYTENGHQGCPVLADGLGLGDEYERFPGAELKWERVTPEKGKSGFWDMIYELRRQ